MKVDELEFEDILDEWLKIDMDEFDYNIERSKIQLNSNLSSGVDTIVVLELKKQIDKLEKEKLEYL